MNSKFDQALHVVSSESAAGTLKVALGIPRNRLLISEDPLSYGPAPATDDLLDWRLIREKFLQGIYLDWPDFTMDHYSENGLLNNITSLAKDKPIIVWASPGLGEQLLIAWLTVLFDRLNLDFSRLLVIQFDFLKPNQAVRAVAELSPQYIQQNSPDARSLSGQEVDEYLQAWRTYTSSDPKDLMRLLSRKLDNSTLFNAMRQLVYRYPSVETGLCRHDEDLLRNTGTHGHVAARIIGQTMGASDDRDIPGDDYLFYRLQRLGQSYRSRPLLTLTGDCKSMRSCYAKLTEYGQEVLDGNPVDLQTDDIDDWIGGVHLRKEMNIPLRIKDELCLPV